LIWVALVVGGRRILWDVVPWVVLSIILLAGLSVVLWVVLAIGLWVVLAIVLLRAVTRLRFLSLPSERYAGEAPLRWCGITLLLVL
jgi:hypothetical protein